MSHLHRIDLLQMSQDYSSKPPGYFDTARKLFVDLLPVNPSARLLEIGTGSGDTAAYAMAQGKCGWCSGFELCEGPAAEARKKLQQVFVGDVEKLEFTLPEKSFDILLLSEVLEHLVDPWAVLRRVIKFLKPGAIIVAGSPNISHWAIIVLLLRGQWRYESRGIFDATHLRWFTPVSYRQMFESCGFIVDHTGPSYPLRWKAKIFNIATAHRFEYLLHTQILLTAHVPNVPTNIDKPIA